MGFRKCSSSPPTFESPGLASYPTDLAKETIEAQLSDKLDIQVAAREYRETRQAWRTIKKLTATFEAKEKAQEWAEASAILDEMEGLLPKTDKGWFSNDRVALCLAAKDLDRARQVAEDWARKAKDNAPLLNGVAWEFCASTNSGPAELKVAAEFADTALKSKRIPGFLDTCGRVSARQGLWDDAKTLELEAANLAAGEQRTNFLHQVEAYAAKKLPD